MTSVDSPAICSLPCTLWTVVRRDSPAFSYGFGLVQSLLVLVFGIFYVVIAGWPRGEDAQYFGLFITIFGGGLLGFAVFFCVRLARVGAILRSHLRLTATVVSLDRARPSAFVVLVRLQIRLEDRPADVAAPIFSWTKNKPDVGHELTLLVSPRNPKRAVLAMMFPAAANETGNDQL